MSDVREVFCVLVPIRILEFFSMFCGTESTGNFPAFNLQELGAGAILGNWRDGILRNLSNDSLKFGFPVRKFMFFLTASKSSLSAFANNQWKSSLAWPPRL